MNDPRFPDTWAPYMTWAKHHAKAPCDLTGSNLLPCSAEDLPGADQVMELYGRNDDGWPPLVEAIAARFGVDESQVATATGGSGANFVALASLVRPGDDVLVEWPGYDPHTGAARFLGARVKTFSRTWEEGFRLNPDRVAHALTANTRAIMLTNLHNPTGVHADREALAAVGALAQSVGAKVVVDEVYLDASFGVDTTPASHLGPAFVSTNSLTKSYGLAGIRVGWLLADPEVVERALRVRDVVDAVGSIPSETIGVLAFRRLDDLLDRARGILSANQSRMASFVEGREDLDWVRPAGGGVAFPRLRACEDATPFVRLAHDRYGVGVTPGTMFGAPAHIRVAVAGEGKVLDRGLDLLARALDEWRG